MMNLELRFTGSSHFGGRENRGPNAAPTPTGFAEIVSDYLPIFRRDAYFSSSETVTEHSNYPYVCRNILRLA